MLAVRKKVVALYADRSTMQWIAQDREGRYWVVPSCENPWKHRQPFEPTDESELEPVPGHYQHMLGIPV